MLLGHNVAGLAKELGGYGADKVYVCEHELLETYTPDAYAKVICDLVEEKKPEVFLIGATNIGRDLGPRCAARLHTGLTADCTHLDVDVEKYKAFLKTTSTIDVDNTVFEDNKNLKMTRPRLRRPPDGHHHLPPVPPPDVHRAPRRDEEGPLRPGQGRRLRH